MSEFNKGWWNCFISFANELAMTERSSDLVINAVLRGAAVTISEIDEVIEKNDDIIEDRVKSILLSFKNHMKGGSNVAK